MQKERLRRGIELGVLMDALLVAYRDRDKHSHIPNIKSRIAKRLEDAGLSVEEVEEFLSVLDRWVYRIINKEV
jgi:hypothetical protein